MDTYMKKMLFTSMIVFGLSGCASNQYAVTFDTNPQGATLICDGQNFGYTPVTLYYDKKNITSGTMNVSNCSAVWSSGASGQYPYYLQVYESGGSKITLPRPNVAGYSQDAEFALKVQNLRANQKAANAAQQSADAQLYNSTNSSFSNTINCKKIGAVLNAEIKTFSGMVCPLGWLPAY